MKTPYIYNFRLINMPDGTQIINPRLSTPDSSLTPAQLIEYSEVENNLSYMERMRKRAERRQEMECRNKSIFSRIAWACGVI